MPPDSSCGKDVTNRGSIRTISNSSSMRRRTASPRRSLWYSMTSLNWFSIRTTGFSEFMLLWNTVEMSRHRIALSSSWLRSVMSTPSKTIEPPLIRPGLSSRRSTAVPKVVFPLPDSPMRPMNSPGSRDTETSCTAVIAVPRLGS